MVMCELLSPICSTFPWAVHLWGRLPSPFLLLQNTGSALLESQIHTHVAMAKLRIYIYILNAFFLLLLASIALSQRCSLLPSGPDLDVCGSSRVLPENSCLDWGCYAMQVWPKCVISGFLHYSATKGKSKRRAKNMRQKLMKTGLIGLC